MAVYSDRDMIRYGAQVADAMRDVPRYEPTGRVDIEFGTPEVVDTWTGRSGVYITSMGVGFCPGGYIDRYGRVAWRHPSDNPLQGYRVEA